MATLTGHACRRHLLTGALLCSLVAGSAAVAAQEASPTPAESPFQTVRVDGFAYSVDPFFPCVAFITQRLTRLDGEGDPARAGTWGVVSTITMQLFVRDGTRMTALQPFTTVENELTATADVGQAFPCAPQVAADEDILNG
jgi:hypothetical protein